MRFHNLSYSLLFIYLAFLSLVTGCADSTPTSQTAVSAGARQGTASDEQSASATADTDFDGFNLTKPQLGTLSADFPKTGQNLVFGAPLAVKINIAGTTVKTDKKVLLSFWQNNKVIYENLADDKVMSADGIVMFYPDHPKYKLLKPGKVKIMVRTYIGKKWSDALAYEVNLLASSAPIVSAEYPKAGQVLDLGGSYIVKTNVANIPDGFGFDKKILLSFWQDGKVIYENWAVDKVLSRDGVVSLQPNHPKHSLLSEGDVKVMARTLFKNNWSEALEYTIKLKKKEPPQIACTDLTLSSNQLTSSNSIAITAKSNRLDVERYTFAFYNLSNNNMPIAFEGRPFKIDSKTPTIQINASQFDMNDSNAANKIKPTNISVAAFLIAAGAQSTRQAACTKQFTIQRRPNPGIRRQ